MEIVSYNLASDSGTYTTGIRRTTLVLMFAHADQQDIDPWQFRRLAPTSGFRARPVAGRPKMVHGCPWWNCHLDGGPIIESMTCPWISSTLSFDCDTWSLLELEICSHHPNLGTTVSWNVIGLCHINTPFFWPAPHCLVHRFNSSRTMVVEKMKNIMNTQKDERHNNRKKQTGFIVTVRRWTSSEFTWLCCKSWLLII